MAGESSRNITWHEALIASGEREALLGQQGCVLWLTGLSGSGKSTIACLIEKKLVDEGRLAYVLDGDNVRHGLCGDLGFSPEDRDENIRRIGEVAALFAAAGVITLAAFISPYKKGRDLARKAAPDGRFLEVHIATPIDACEERDPKGLYEKARKGEIQDFTGINAPYEVPESPEITIDTSRMNQEECAEVILGSLRERGLLEPPRPLADED